MNPGGGQAAAAAPAPRSPRANVAANYASLAFSMAATVLALPLYLRLMGTEAFGLVGVFTLLNAAFQVFDAGLSQTFARECARYAGGARDLASLRRLLATFEIVFAVVAMAGAGLIALAAPFLATGWLRAARLPAGEIETAVALMGLAIAAQWVSGLYRGVLIGLERQVALSAFTIAVTAARAFGPIAVLVWTRGDPVAFFAWQAAVSGVELAAIFAAARRTLRSPAGMDEDPPQRGLPWGEFRGVLRFSGGVALTALSWLVLLQGDKLILSRVLSLGDYGVFTLAVTASTALAGLGVPIAQAILPRLTRLVAQADAPATLALYGRASEITCLVAMPAALVLACFARPALYVWTGDASLAERGAPILAAYAVGGGLATLTVFPYYLQYAHGRLGLHLKGQALSLVVVAPAYLLAALHWGARGTGAVWTLFNAAYLLFWAPAVHARFAPDLRRRWVLSHLAPVIAAAAAASLVLSWTLTWPPGRVGAAFELAGVSGLVLAAAVASSFLGRGLLAGILARIR